MIKFRLYYDKDAEQVWLNKMAEKGWALQHFFLGFYTFRLCEPGEYVYQIDMLDNWSGEKDNFEEFMSELKIEIVAQWWRWVFLRKKAADGPFELYTDTESKIAQYTRIRNFFKFFTIVELLIFFYEVWAYVITKELVVLFCCLLIGVCTWVIMRIAFKCNRKIIELRHGEGTSGKTKPSIWIAVGLLLNSGALIVSHFWEALPHPISLVMIICACLLIGVGFLQEVQRMKIK